MRAVNLFFITGLLIFSLSSIMSVYLYAECVTSFTLPGYQDILYKASPLNTVFPGKDESLLSKEISTCTKLLEGCRIESRLEEIGRLYRMQRLTGMSI